MKGEILERYASKLAESRFKAHYVSYARAFLEYAGSTLDDTQALTPEQQAAINAVNRETVTAYLKKMRRQGKAPGTVAFTFSVIRAMFRVNKIEWPFRRGAGPTVGQRDVYKPALAFELIGKMIGSARDGKVREDTACFLALSTTYGLRRSEMCNLGRNDVDLGGSILFVATAKSGRERYHLIPDEIKPYMEKHDFEARYSYAQMSKMFWEVVNAAELSALGTQRLGWHTIRRPLLTGLIDAGLNPFAARAFMRWKAPSAEGGLAMPEHYYGNVVIGLDGSKVVFEEAKDDRDVFENYHPFIGLWRDDE